MPHRLVSLYKQLEKTTEREAEEEDKEDHNCEANLCGGVEGGVTAQGSLSLAMVLYHFFQHLQHKQRTAITSQAIHLSRL